MDRDYRVSRMALAVGLAGVVWASRPAATTLASSQTATSAPASILVTLTLRLSGGRRQFRPGEIIPIELEFASDVLGRFAVDGAANGRIGIASTDAFHVEPLDAVTDPMLDYLASRGVVVGSFLGTTGVLGGKPYVVTLDLNEWFRFDTAGEYTVSVHSTRVTDEAGPAAGATVPLDSNTVVFDVLPRDAQWEKDALAAAVSALDTAVPNLGGARRACHALGALGTDAAVDEMIARYGSDTRSGCDIEYTIGLFQAPNHARTVRQLEAGLRAREQAVTPPYLRTLAILSIFEQHPEVRPAQIRDAKGRMPVDATLGGRQDLIDAYVASCLDQLTAVLPEKSDRARAVTIAAQPQLFAVSSVATAAGFAAGFQGLPANQQRSLLDYGWPRIASPAMLPALRQLAAAPPSPPPSLADLALRRLYELSPDEGRALILREIARPPFGATVTTLGMLPDAELPALDETFAAGLEASRRLDDLNIRADLIARYASPAVGPQVRAYLDRRLGQMECRPQTSLLEYFLRIDQALGESLLNRALDARQSTGCYRSLLQDMAAVRMTPGIVAAAVAHLDDEDMQISAINTLARDGSPASRALLRAKFERWHQTWQGRASELRYNPMEAHRGPVEGMIESSLFRALGQDRADTISRPEADELRALCVTDSCRISAELLANSVEQRNRRQ